MALTKVLVTGGCGFLGTAIIVALLEGKRFKITAVDITPPPLGTQSFTTNPLVNYVRANVLDPERLSKVFAETQPDIVIHTVGVYPLGSARYSVVGKDEVFKVNVEGTRNVLEAAKLAGVKGFVYTSSITAVMDELDKDFRNVDESWPTGRAVTSYGMSKALSESLVLSANAPSFLTTCLRSCPIFGPGDITVIPTIHALIATHSTPFILGSGTNLQDYIYISNIADAHVLAALNLLGPGTAAGEVFYVSNGEPVSLRDICLAIWKEFNHVPAFQVRVPEGLAWGLGYVAEWVGWVAGGRDVGFSRGLVSDGCRDRYCDIGKAREVLGYVPRVGMVEGIRRGCVWYKGEIEGRRRKGEVVL